MKECLSCGFEYLSRSWECPSCGFEPKTDNNIIVLLDSAISSRTGFKAEYFQELNEYEARSFWFRARNIIILMFGHRYLKNAKSFCEIGTGNAFVLSAICKKYPFIDAVGTDIFKEGLNNASARLEGAELVQLDARKLPYINHFECIGLFDTLEHIPEDRVVMGQIHKALTPGGVVIITVPQHPWLWSNVDEHACHQRRYQKQDIQQKMRDAGFRLRCCTSFVSLLLPIMIIQRLFIPKQDLCGKSLPGLNVLESVLFCIMQFEILLIRLGVRFPVGGSLLLIGERE